MQFSLELFRILVLSAVWLAAGGALVLALLFAVDTLRRRIW